MLKKIIIYIICAIFIQYNVNALKDYRFIKNNVFLEELKKNIAYNNSEFKICEDHNCDSYEKDRLIFNENDCKIDYSRIVFGFLEYMEESDNNDNFLKIVVGCPLIHKDKEEIIGECILTYAITNSLKRHEILEFLCSEHSNLNIKFKLIPKYLIQFEILNKKSSPSPMYDNLDKFKSKLFNGEFKQCCKYLTYDLAPNIALKHEGLEDINFYYEFHKFYECCNDNSYFVYLCFEKGSEFLKSKIWIDDFGSLSHY